MELTKNASGFNFEQRVATLGYLGVVPLLVATLLILMPWQNFPAVDFVRNYAAVVLTFIGAIHWGRSLNNRQARLVTFSVLPSLLASACLMLSVDLALPLLALGFVLLLVIDYQLLNGIKWFLSLRFRLTAMVVSLLLVAWIFTL